MTVEEQIRALRALDLFCGAGGAAMGLHRAGFEVVGVDIADQPHYPFEFHKADALEFPLDGFDLIWASPPCQAYCSLSAIHRNRSSHPKLIEPVRRRLLASGAYYIIENVPGAPLFRPVLLCGSTFGLRVRRHRHFESNLHLWSPQPGCLHAKQGRSVGVYGHQGSGALCAREHGGAFIRAKNRDDAGDAMGIDWMTWRELTQAIPPAYSEFLGRQALRALLNAACPL
jgi:DNA (cytosine-5)-methyltransferase 1